MNKVMKNTRYGKKARMRSYSSGEMVEVDLSINQEENNNKEREGKSCSLVSMEFSKRLLNKKCSQKCQVVQKESLLNTCCSRLGAVAKL